MPTITLTRQQLYDRAWTTPLDALAKEARPLRPRDGGPKRRPAIEFGKHLCRHRVRGMATTLRFTAPQGDETVPEPDATSRFRRATGSTTATTASPHSRPIAIRSPTSLRHWVRVGVVALQDLLQGELSFPGQRGWRPENGLRRVEARQSARVSPDRPFGSYR